MVDIRSPHRDFMTLFTRILRNRYFMEAGAAALQKADEADTSDDEMRIQVRGWYNLFHGIRHIFIGCGVPVDCAFCKPRLPTSRTSVMKIRPAFERVALPTLATLSKNSEYQYLWKQLIKFFDITAESVRSRYQHGQKCSDVYCASRLFGSQSEKKRVCLGCLSVFYCGRGCQKR